MSPRKKILLQKSLVLTVRKKKTKIKKKKVFFLQFQQNILEHDRNLQILNFNPPSPQSQCWNQANFQKKVFQNWVPGEGDIVWEKKFMKFTQLFHLFCPRLSEDLGL